jgi:hypothetical protein
MDDLVSAMAAIAFKRKQLAAIQALQLKPSRMLADVKERFLQMSDDE